MGSAVSTRAPLKAPIDVTSNRKYVLKFDDEDVVNNFAKEIFMVSPKIDALQHVLSTDRGRTAFMDFLLTEYAEENLSFFIVSYLV